MTTREQDPKMDKDYCDATLKAALLAGLGLQTMKGVACQEQEEG